MGHCIDKTLKTKGEKIGIVNHQKRKNLVKFSWKVSRDIVIPGFKYLIEQKKLVRPRIFMRVQPKSFYRQTVYLSEYLYTAIQRICSERWPTQGELNHIEFVKRQREANHVPS